MIKKVKMVREFGAFRAASLGISFALSWHAATSFAPSSAHIRPHSLLRSIAEPADGGGSVVGPAPPAFASVGRRTAVAALIAASALPPPSLASVPALVAPKPSDAMKNAVVFGGSRPFPLASFGLQVYNDDTAYKLTLTALETGFRNFFASVLAGNQRGFARAVKDSKIPRSELYICGTVLSNRERGYDAALAKTKQGCAENMAAMAAGGIDHLDMIMLDYPGPDSASIRGQWRAFEQMKSEGTVDDLAVSNFSAPQLDSILGDPDAKFRPTVNQLPFSLAYHPTGLLEYNAERGIHVQSWSPLSRVLGKYGKDLAAIGKKYNKSAAQVGLRWIVQSGASFTTQTKSMSHFEEDLNVFDFELSKEDFDQLLKITDTSL